MGFEVLAPESSGRPRLSRPDNVVMALEVTRKQGRSTNEHLDIRIGADLLRRLDWSFGANLLVAEGRDTDLGRCEVRRAQLGTNSRVLTEYTGSRTGNRQYARLRWPVSSFRYHRLTSTSVNPMVVMHEVRGSTLVLSLPIWLAVPAPAIPAPAVPQQLL